jgi:hypothetical protein
MYTCDAESNLIYYGLVSNAEKKFTIYALQLKVTLSDFDTKNVVLFLCSGNGEN